MLIGTQSTVFLASSYIRTNTAIVTCFHISFDWNLCQLPCLSQRASNTPLDILTLSHLSPRFSSWLQRVECPFPESLQLFAPLILALSFSLAWKDPMCGLLQLRSVAYAQIIRLALSSSDPIPQSSLALYGPIGFLVLWKRHARGTATLGVLE